MSQDQNKQRAAAAALAYIQPGTVIGVGTGSTVNFFIDALAGSRERIAGAVSSSAASSRRLAEHGIPLLDLNECRISTSTSTAPTRRPVTCT
jgi:ribose 5-phosphate isomerase A